MSFLSFLSLYSYICYWIDWNFLASFWAVLAVFDQPNDFFLCMEETLWMLECLARDG